MKQTFIWHFCLAGKGFPALELASRASDRKLVPQQNQEWRNKRIDFRLTYLKRPFRLNRVCVNRSFVNQEFAPTSNCNEVLM